MEESSGSNDVIYIDWSHWRMQPKVVLERLSEEDIKFYTRKRRGRVKKEIASKNLRDISRVDFSLFEEYRRSRKTFLRKKEKSKKTVKKTPAAKGKAIPKKKAQSEDAAAATSTKTSVASSPPASKCKLPKKPKPVAEPPVKKPRGRKRKADTEAAPKTPKEQPKKKKIKKRAMVIESDSDCSVENYGIVYSNERSGADISLQNHAHLTPVQNIIPFKTQVNQTSLSNASKAMVPSRQEVIVSENDILSALDFEPAEPITKLAMKGNNFVKPLACLNQNLPPEGRNSSVANKLTSFSDSLMADVKSKYDSEDMLKEFDVVSRIMQEMDMDFQTRKKVQPPVPPGASSQLHQPSQPPSKDTVMNATVIRLSSDSGHTTALPKILLPPASKNVSSVKDKSNVDPKCPVGPLSKCSTNSVRKKNIYRWTSVPVKLYKEIHPDVVKVVGSLVKNVEKSCANLQDKLDFSARRLQREMRICMACHCQYRPIHADAKNICTLCRSPVMKIDPTLRKKQYSPMRNVWNRSRPNILGRSCSTFNGKYLKEDTGMLKSRFVRLPKYTKNTVLKSLNPYDRRRVTYKNSNEAEPNISMKLGASKSVVPAEQVANNTKPITIPAVAAAASQKQTDGKKNCDLSVCEPRRKSSRAKSTESFREIEIQKISLDQTLNEKCEKNANLTSHEAAVGKPLGEIKSTDLPKTPADSEKGDFTVKPVEKGLYLMTYSEPDKELDLEDNCLSEFAQQEKNDTPKKASPMETSLSTTDKSQPLVSEVIEPPKTSSMVSDLNKIECRYVIPQVPTVIVAEYAVSADDVRDFHLSSVSIENDGVSKSLTIPCESDSSTARKSSRSVSSTTKVTSTMMPSISATVASSPGPSGSVQVTASGSTTPAISVSVVDAPRAVTNTASISVMPAVNSTVSIAGCSSSTVRTSPLKALPPPPAKGELPAFASLVSHELDAVAILSILDLDSNEENAKKLLDNLLRKEIRELHKIIEMCPPQVEDADMKDAMNMKINSKLGKIKSINIARALLRKYGALPKVIEAVLQNPTSLPAEKIDEKQVDQSMVDDECESLLTIKSEMVSEKAQSCLYATKDSRQETQIMPYVPPALSPSCSPSHSLDASQMQNQEPSYIVTEMPDTPTPPIRVKSESSSSCMMSSCSSPVVQSNHIDNNHLSRMNVHLNSLGTTASIPEFEPIVSASSDSVTTSSMFMDSSMQCTRIPMQQNTQLQQDSSTSSELVGLLTRSPMNATNSRSDQNYPQSAINTGTSINPKSELSKSSCQLQNSTATATVSSPQQIQPPTSLSQYSGQSQVNSRTSNVAPSMSIQSYRQILPAGAYDKQPCPNRTVPFSSSSTLQSVLQGRGPTQASFPVQFQQNTSSNAMYSASTSSANPLRVQQVVLSSLQPSSQQLMNQNQVALMSSSNQRQLAIMPSSNQSQLAIMPSSAQNGLALMPTSNASQLTVMSSGQNQLAVMPSGQNQLSVMPSGQNQLAIMSSSSAQNQLALMPSSNQNQVAVMPYNYRTVPSQQVGAQINCGGNVLVRLQVQQQQLQRQQQRQQPQISNVFTMASQHPQTSQAVHQRVVPGSQNVRISPAMPNNQNSQSTTPNTDYMDSLSFCVMCRKPAQMRCKQCAKIVYCNTECAKIYWNERHKFECKPTSGVT